MTEKRTHIPIRPSDDGYAFDGNAMTQFEELLCRADAHDVVMTHIGDLGKVIPELLPMKGFDQRSRYHCYDVLEHTAYVVQYVKPTPLLRWAALLHDVGKPTMFAIDKHGVGHFKGHAWKGARLTHDIMARLGSDPTFARHVELLVRYHDDRIEPTAHAVKRRLSSLDNDPELFAALCDLKRADAMAHAPDWRMQRVGISEQLMDCLGKILDEGQVFRPHDLAVNEADIRACGVDCEAYVGKILDRVLDAIITDKVPNDRETLLDLIDTMANAKPND